MHSAMRISDLPNDILVLLFCACRNLTDLQNFILAARPLHDAFGSRQKTVLDAVIGNMFPSEIESLAISALLCRRNKTDRNDALSDPSFGSILDDWTSTCSALPRSSPVFRDMIRNQNVLYDLTEDLCRHSFAVARYQGYAVADDEPPPSDEEFVRIHGAFHLIDIFYCLCGEGHHRLEVRDALLLDLPPWRLDELACVHDYLKMRLAALSERCSELGMRGSWDYFRAATVTTPVPMRGISHWIEQFIVGGLEQCHAAIILDRSSGPESARYQDICQILDVADLGSHARGIWLSSALDETSGIRDDDKCMIDSSDQHKGTSGPNAAWKWRRHGVRYDWANLEEEDLAAWCSSVWDESRLQRWGVLDKPRDTRASASWSSQRSQRLEVESYQRLSTDRNRPKTLPCSHGIVMPAVPPRKGTLWYQEMPAGFSSWSTCYQCYLDRARSDLPPNTHLTMVRLALKDPRP